MAPHCVPNSTKVQGFTLKKHKIQRSRWRVSYSLNSGVANLAQHALLALLNVHNLHFVVMGVV